MGLCENPHGFLINIMTKLGDGKELLFWKHCWLGESTLEALYPSLFKQLISKEQ